jgi:hypothetical protein
VNNSITVTIYKAPQPGKAQVLLEKGVQKSNFPASPPMADGKCYFAAPGSRHLTEEYQGYYKDGILEVIIDLATYTEIFKPLERPYQGGPWIELPIPWGFFEVLN